MKTLLTLIAAVMLSVSATVSACEFSGGGGDCNAPVSVHNPNAPLPDGAQVLVDMLVGQAGHTDEEMDVMKSGLMNIINSMAAAGGYGVKTIAPNQEISEDDLLVRASLRGKCDVPTFNQDTGILKMCKAVVTDDDDTTVWSGELNFYWDGNVLEPIE